MQRHFTSFLLFIGFGTILFLQSCLQDSCNREYTYTAYLPIFKSYEEIRASVASQPAKAIEATGKMFVKGDWLFINEPFKGIHVIDNSNPSNPVNRGFIKIPGNIDLAVRGNYLYADSYMDLVTLDITDPLNAKEVDRELNALPVNATVHPDSGIVVDYREEIRTETMACGMNYRGWENVTFTDASTAALDMTAGTPGTPGSSEAPGLGGSLARFSLANDHLYIVDSRNLHAYNVSTSSDPSFTSTEQVGFDIETIWHNGFRLFLGSMTGMYIYDISSTPATPQYVSTYTHIRSCDPVVVQGNYAFLTLRNGTPCGGFTNQLEVINISDITNPVVEHVYPMHNPIGVGVDQNTLFVCDNTEGLKVYDASDVATIDQNMVDYIHNITAVEVIPVFYDDIAIIGTPQGIYQYDYSDPSNLVQLSWIPVAQ